MGPPSSWWLAACGVIAHHGSFSLLTSLQLITSCCIWIWLFPFQLYSLRVKAFIFCNHFFFSSLISLVYLCRAPCPGASPKTLQNQFGQKWVVPMRVTPVTIRPRQGARCQSWCLEWDTASGPTRSVLSGTARWKMKRARPAEAPAVRDAVRASRGSGGRWTPSWSGPRMSARGWRSRTRTCTMPSSAKC